MKKDQKSSKSQLTAKDDTLLKVYTSGHFEYDHLSAIFARVNQEFLDGVTTFFDTMVEDEDKFSLFFEKITHLSFGELSCEGKADLSFFLVNCFRHLEVSCVRTVASKYISLPMWEHVSLARRSMEFEENPVLKRHWELAQSSKVPESSEAPAKKRAKKSPAKVAASVPASQSDLTSSDWFPGLLKDFLSAVDAAEDFPASLKFIERFSELLLDLLSQLSTRRFLNTLIDDMHVVTRCRRSALFGYADSRLFREMIDAIDNVSHFEVNDWTGKPFSSNEVIAAQSQRTHTLQNLAFSHHFETLRDLVFSSTGEASKRANLFKHLSLLDSEAIIALGLQSGYVSQEVIDSFDGGDVDVKANAAEFVMEVLLDQFSSRQSQLDLINRSSLYPTEEFLWNPNTIPLSQSYSGDQVLALPKLNVQFLTVHDYLVRNFHLFRLESAFEIREDLVDAIRRMGPKENIRGTVTFSGWARMALPVASMTIDEVGTPLLGEIIPRKVICSVDVDIARFTGVIRGEWESLREHDVVFLVCIEHPRGEIGGNELEQFEAERSEMSAGQKPRKRKDFQWKEADMDFPSQFGVKFVRAGEIFEVRDEDNNIVTDPSKPELSKNRVGTKRRFRMRLDAAQYYDDIKNERNCYDSFNLIVRRKPQENNFKAVLETIRSLMNTAAIGKAIPPWLNDVFLGHGDPKSASFRNLAKLEGNEKANYVDTFVDQAHLENSFPNCKVSFATESCSPPYRISFHSDEDGKETVTASHYDPINAGPYPQDKPPLNTVRFTAKQVEAIRSGVNAGLTMVVGPPGTGKTDVAVQIIMNLYHNFPNQKILLVTHSNAALNDLFEKIMSRDIDPRHLLRLGSGERELSESLAQGGAAGSGRGQGEEFSKQGRVNWSLARRQELLGVVQRLAESLNITGDVGYSCETSSYFYVDHIQPRLKKFDMVVAQGSKVSASFPFFGYFSDVAEGLFSGVEDSDEEVARGCFRHVNKIFEELADYRAFELLRTQAHRSDYLLTKQARIVAMTCTHAAMTRQKLVDLGFKYDSLIMEEAAQILEVETLIPMLLQTTDVVEGCRLKRVVLIGDHHQLPPVVKHRAFQKYSRLDQSMFARFVRLGVPAVMLDAQGRARAEIANLYSWRYKTLGNLPLKLPEFQTSNAGFVHTFQLINVEDFKGKGESAPTPFFYQNLGEAEYVVAVYQYMRLIGYPAEKISILTSYNGQKNLIQDILSQRCRNSLFGFPSSVTTVDKYQGQQNDFILLSLVRTESVGHLRDVRRLVVALSRARLGLYVFCRQELFQKCFELSPAINQFLDRPNTLQLVVGESIPTTRGVLDTPDASQVHSVSDVTAMGVLVYQMVQQSQSQMQS